MRFEIGIRFADRCKNVRYQQRGDITTSVRCRRFQVLPNRHNGTAGSVGRQRRYSGPSTLHGLGVVVTLGSEFPTHQFEWAAMIGADVFVGSREVVLAIEDVGTKGADDDFAIQNIASTVRHVPARLMAKAAPASG